MIIHLLFTFVFGSAQNFHFGAFYSRNDHTLDTIEIFVRNHIFTLLKDMLKYV